MSRRCVVGVTTAGARIEQWVVLMGRLHFFLVLEGRHWTVVVAQTCRSQERAGEGRRGQERPG